MKILTVTEANRHFRENIDSVEYEQQEIVLTRNGKPVARLIPEIPAQNALEVFDDLYRAQIGRRRSVRYPSRAH